jgi:hypothetical protein
MPIPLKSFIHVLQGIASSVDKRISLNANYSDDRIDYAGCGVSGSFMTRNEIDGSDYSYARNRSEVIKIIFDNE